MQLQLQEFSSKQQQIELHYRPVVQQLPTLLQQLQPEELSQAAEFAVVEGLRAPILQVRARDSCGRVFSNTKQTEYIFGLLDSEVWHTAPPSAGPVAAATAALS